MKEIYFTLKLYNARLSNYIAPSSIGGFPDKLDIASNGKFSKAPSKIDNTFLILQEMAHFFLL